MYNQLTSAVGTGVNATMDYDPVGRLSQITGAGVVTKFGYSGTQMITEYNSSDTVLRRYVHGVGSDEPIVWYEGAGTSVRKWMTTDQQGSITAITNSAGSVTNKNTYNEYGVPDVGNVGRFQYTGQIWLAEAQVYHYKARAYDPYLGRFLQTDPIGYAAGMNMYAYVGGDPVNYRDPSGLKKDPCAGIPHCVSGKRRKRSTGVSFSSIDFGFRGFLFAQNTIDLSGAYGAAIEAACKAGKAGLKAVRKGLRGPALSLFPDHKLAQQLGYTQILQANLGVRAVLAQGTGSIAYAESRDGSAVGFSVNGGVGRGETFTKPPDMSDLRKAFLLGGYGSVGLGVTNAPLGALTSSSSTSINGARGMLGFIGASGGMIATDSGDYFVAFAEVGRGIAVDVNTGIKSNWYSCQK